MDYKKLNTGAKIPMLGFGTFLVNGDDCRRSVCEAIKTGYRLIDTAEAYGNEKQVGLGIKDSGIDRKELFLVTKVNFKSYESTRNVVLSSMKKLQTDYLDLVLLHWPFGNYYAAWRALEEMHQEGTIHAIGVSNFDPDRLIDLISFNKILPAINQIETNIFCQRKTERAWLDKYNVAHMAYAPLGQGHKNEMFVLPEVTALAEKYGKTPAQILLRFQIQSGVIVIPKSIHTERIHENFSVFDFVLADNEIKSLQQLDNGLPMIGNAEKPEMVEKAMNW